MFEEEARERSSANLKQNSTDGADLQRRDIGRSSSKAAETVNVSPRLVEPLHLARAYQLRR
ncbi:MAG: hypothetical protein LAQ30_26740 [Acidobacteriia bacterium]|nr:hypothetical protein [Terriglobia bacterium]